MAYQEFDNLINELDIHLKQEQKKALYPLIATKNEIQIEMFKQKVMELKEIIYEL